VGGSKPPWARSWFGRLSVATRLALILGGAVFVTAILVALVLPPVPCHVPPGVVDIPGPCPDPRVGLRVGIAFGGLFVGIIITSTPGIIREARRYRVSAPSPR
jgi:hypothetical protein